MTDWTSEAIVEAFPKANVTYYIQFVTEPEVLLKEAQGGRKYKQVLCRMQFFAPNDVGEYVYIGWGEKAFQPCVLEDLTTYAKDILTRMFEVKGMEHKRHVDLEVITSYDRQQASATLTKPQPSGPTKSELAAVQTTVPPPAAASNCSHENIGLQTDENNELEGKGFYCKDCGERVG